MDKNCRIAIILIVIVCLTGCIEESNEPRIPMKAGTTGDGQKVGLSLGWNMVSMPNSTVKFDVSLEYNNTIYNWNDSVAQGLILDFIYGYKDGNFYIYDSFIKYKGYWLYTYVDGLNLTEDDTSTSSVVRLGKLFVTNESDINITCDILIIAPEFYDTELYCWGITATDKVIYIFNGQRIEVSQQ